MLKPFTKRSLFIGLLSMFMLGSMATDAIAATVVNCVTAYKYLSTGTGGAYACQSATASITGCSKQVTYTIKSAAGSDTGQSYKSCENYVNYSGTTTHACANDYTAYPVTLTFDGATITAYGCCKSTSSTSTATIPSTSTPRGTRTTTTTQNTWIGVEKPTRFGVNTTWTKVASDDCPTGASSKYSCTCKTGFKVQSQDTSTCNCDAYATGYSCYVAYCTQPGSSMAGGAQIQFSNLYISADRKSCKTCPTGAESGVSDKYKIYASSDKSTSAGVSATLLGGTSYATSVNACHKTSGYDINGNQFEFTNNCYYTE